MLIKFSSSQMMGYIQIKGVDTNIKLNINLIISYIRETVQWH